jgi:hypothetical protein
MEGTEKGMTSSNSLRPERLKRFRMELAECARWACAQTFEVCGACTCMRLSVWAGAACREEKDEMNTCGKWWMRSAAAERRGPAVSEAFRTGAPSWWGSALCSPTHTALSILALHSLSRLQPMLQASCNQEPLGTIEPSRETIKSMMRMMMMMMMMMNTRNGANKSLTMDKIARDGKILGIGVIIPQSGGSQCLSGSYNNTTEQLR